MDGGIRETLIMHKYVSVLIFDGKTFTNKIQLNSLNSYCLRGPMCSYAKYKKKLSAIFVVFFLLILEIPND